MSDALPEAPELPDGLVFVDPARPVRLRSDCRGQVVLLLFFRGSCVHCRHALPTLAWLELRFARRPLRVLGVHCGQDSAEDDPEHVRELVERLGIRHAVAVDRGRAAWRAFGATAWPFLWVVDAQGRLRYRGAGEPDRDRLAAAVEVLLGDARGDAPPVLWPTMPVPATERTRLSWPAAVAVDAARGLLWIADTGRHRVVSVDLDDGALRHVVGNGRPSFADGDLATAGLASPHGMAVHDGAVLVADTTNHAIRRIDVDAHELSTLCGTGDAHADPVGGLLGREQGIASPLDVVVVDGAEALVAMTGLHQLWSVDLDSTAASAFAGTGTRGLVDGMRADAELSEPRALAADHGRIAFVEGGGALRVVDRLTGIVGTWLAAPALSGAGGIAWHDGALLVADTRGDRIVRVDPRTRNVTPLCGSEHGLRRPEGLAVHDGVLFVANSGAHEVLRVELATLAVARVAIHDPHPDETPTAPSAVRLRANATATLCFPMALPFGMELDRDAPPRALVRNAEGSVLRVPVDGELEREGEWGIVRELPTGAPGHGVLELVVRYAMHARFVGQSHVHELRATVAVELALDAPDSAETAVG
jgi:sugar lactone lactonase YvrE